MLDIYNAIKFPSEYNVRLNEVIQTFVSDISLYSVQNVGITV